MTHFTQEELNLICLYDSGNRTGAIYELRDMMRYLMPDETELKASAESAVSKLEGMTDAEYDELIYGLNPPSLADLFNADSAWKSAASFPMNEIGPDSDIE